MNQKKAFSYFMWVIYSMALCVCLLSIAGTLSKRAGYSQFVGYGVIGLWLVLCGLLVFLVSMLVGKFYIPGESGKMSSLVTESLAVVILFVVGCVLRMGGLFGASEGSAYFELAKVVEGQTLPAEAHGAVSLYLYLLHFVFRLFGNQFLAGIWLQIILQMIAGFFIYRAVRKMGGVIASVVALGFIMIGPMMINGSMMLSPETLFLAIYGIALYLCAVCIRGKKGPVSCLVTGVVIAVVCCLDIMGITLLLMTVLGLLREGSETDRKLSGRLVGTLLCILSCGVGFALIQLANSAISGKTFGEVLSTWLGLYYPTEFKLPPMLDIADPSVEILCLLLVMSLGIFSFWCCYGKECQSIWIWLVAFQLLIQCFGMTTGELSGRLNLYIIFAVLAGVGVGNMFSVEENDEEDDNGESDKEESVSLVNVKEPEEKRIVVKKIENEPAAEVAKPKSVVIRVPANPGTPATSGNPGNSGTPGEKPVVEEQPKVKLIENPLPLPKKHVKKTMDYDLELSKGQDDFDLEVADDDDFDI